MHDASARKYPAADIHSQFDIGAQDLKHFFQLLLRGF